jgi:hypothetical protein
MKPDRKKKLNAALVALLCVALLAIAIVALLVSATVPDATVPLTLSSFPR